MQATLGMPLEEYIRLYDKNPFELILGKQIPLFPQVAGHSIVVHTLFIALDRFVVARELGETYMRTTFVLLHTNNRNWIESSYTPDIEFFTAKHITDYKAAIPDWRERPFSMVPDMIAEILAPTDNIDLLNLKIDQYLVDGVRLIWVIDPQRRKAVVYAPDLEQPIHLAGDAILDGGDVIPGFQVPLAKLFE